MATSRMEIEDTDDNTSLAAKQTAPFYSLRRSGVSRPLPTAGAKRDHEKADSEPTELKRRKLSEEKHQHQNSLDINSRLKAFEVEIAEIRRAQLGYESKLNELASELTKTSDAALEWQKKAIEAECKIQGLEDKAESTVVLYKGVIKELLNHDGQKLDAMREEIVNTKNMQAALAREVLSLRGENVSTECDPAVEKTDEVRERASEDEETAKPQDQGRVVLGDGDNKGQEHEERSSARHQARPRDKSHPASRAASPDIKELSKARQGGERSSSARREERPGDELQRRAPVPTIEEKRTGCIRDYGQEIEGLSDLHWERLRNNEQEKSRRIPTTSTDGEGADRNRNEKKSVEYDADSESDVWEDAPDHLQRSEGSDSDGEGTADTPDRLKRFSPRTGRGSDRTSESHGARDSDSEDTVDAPDLKGFSSRDGRRNERFFQRSTVAKKLVDVATQQNHADVPVLQYVQSLVVNLGPAGMSSDESTIEDGEDILDVHEMPWRQDITDLMDYLDDEYEEAMKPLDAANSEATTPRRVRRNIKSSLRAPFEDKDEALFNPSWLSSASPAQKPKFIKKGTFTWTPVVFKPLVDVDEN